MAGDRVLALDMGTSSVRALVVADDRPGPVARRSVTVEVDDSGAGTLDADAYQGALVQCLDELDARGALGGVGLVASSGQWHSVVPVGSGGEPLGPVITWFDARPAAEPGTPGPADPAAFHQRTGTWWHRMYWTVRLPWLRAQLGHRPARFRGLPELVLASLLGEAPMSVSMASGTGMLDLVGLRWDAEACSLAGVRPGELPDLAPADWRGQLLPTYGQRWPSLRNVPWMASTGDGAASNFGSGCEDERRVAVTVGTSAAVRMVQAAAAGAALPHLPDSLWRYRVDHDRIVTGAAYSAGGNLFKWAKHVLRLPEGSALEAALDRVEPRNAVWADPRLGGDRPPGTAAHGSGELRGLGFTTTAVQIWAGLMDGVCRLVKRDLAELESTRAGLGEYADVMLAGRAVASSAWWRRAFQEALAPRTVTHVAEPEVGALGAARVALSSR